MTLSPSVGAFSGAFYRFPLIGGWNHDGEFLFIPVDLIGIATRRPGIRAVKSEGSWDSVVSGRELRTATFFKWDLKVVYGNELESYIPPIGGALGGINCQLMPWGAYFWTIPGDTCLIKCTTFFQGLFGLQWRFCRYHSLLLRYFEYIARGALLLS